MERFGPPAVLIHRRPAVDETHQIEGPAQHVGVRTHADGCGVRDIGAVERFDDAPLPQDALVAVGWCTGRRHAQHAGFLAAANLVDDVLGAAGQEVRGQRLACTGQAGVVHPICQPCNVYLTH